MKKIISVVIIILCCLLVYTISDDVVSIIKDNFVQSVLEKDKYTPEEYEDFQQLLQKKTFYYYKSLSEEQKDSYITLYYAVMNFDASCRVDVTEDELRDLLYSIIYDNSNIFWLSGDYTYYNHNDYIQLVPEYKMSKIDAEKITLQLNNKVDEIISGMPINYSDFDKELYLHDYICANTEYDKSTYENGGDTAFSSLLDGKSICEGYARAMQTLLDAVDIKNYLVVGDGTSDGKTEPHMWNIVNIDGYNYHLDVTWNDGVFSDGTSYFYFNVTDNYIKKDHSNLSPENNDCIYNYANYFVKNNLYVSVFSGFSTLTNATATVLRSGESSVGILFANNADYVRAKNGIVNNYQFFEYVKNSVILSKRNLSQYNVDYFVTDDYNYICIIFKED